MRILFIEEVFYPAMGGVCIHILNLAKELIREGVTCSVLTLRTDNALKEREVHTGIEVIRASSLVAAGLFLANNRNRFDLVHAHTSRRPKTAVCMLVAKLLGFPLVFTPHAYYPARSRANAVSKFLYDVSLGRWSIHAADYVVNLTEVDLEHGLVRGQVRERSVIIPNSIDYQRLVDTRPTVDFKSKYGVRSYVLYVGRVTPVKNVEWLVRAMSFVNPETSLVVIGPDDGEVERLKRLAKGLGVSSRIQWVGRVDFEDLVAAYLGCEILVLPSRHEGLPTVVLEAMALGRPVAASAKGGNRCLITEGETGYFCDETPETLSEILGALARENQDNRLGHNASRLVRERYSWDVNAKRLISLYANLCQGDASRRDRVKLSV